jgi:LacI family transcriptional regulator
MGPVPPPHTVTLKDVAKAANVHVSTASRALDPVRSERISRATVQRVQDAAEQLSYMPDMVAKGLKRGTTAMVGVIVADLGNPFIGPIIHGISAELEGKGYVPVVAETLEDHTRFESILNHLLTRRVSAVVTTAAKTGDRPLLTRFAERMPAIVLAVRGLEGSGLPYVIQDDRRGAELAAAHLIGFGHRILAQLRGPDGVEPFLNRAEGFRRTVGSQGRVDVTVSDSARALTVEEGRRLMRATLDENTANPPTAVFAHADMLAIGAIEELRSRGLRCPEDVSVIGYDDAPLVRYLQPALSTIRLPGAEIGTRAGEIVDRLIEDPEAEPDSVTLPAELTARESTGPAPA